MTEEPPAGTHVAEAGNLRAGDLIAAMDAPDGPWRRVRELDRARRVVVVTDPEGDDPVDVPIGHWQDRVLRRDR